jgi:hypothetical protein
MRQGRVKRFALAGSLAALSLATCASPAPASASVTIGQTGADDPVTCSSDDEAQPPVSTGTQYEVPSTGGVVNWTLTSWSHQAKAISDEQQIKVKVWRQVSGLTYTVVGQDGPRILTSGVLNTFAASIPVKPGDILGITPVTDNTFCAFGPPVETYYFGAGDTPTGAQQTFIPSSGRRLNISATLEPTNTFTLGNTSRNKKKGTATLTVTVPNPGELTGSGKGVKVASAAVISKTVTAPGSVKLTIRAKGKKMKTLNETGKVKVKPKITYTPTGGDPSTQSVKVKLKKQL